MTKTLRVLLLKERQGWVAQCLEYDVAAQGKSIKEAQRNFRQIFFGQIAFDLSKDREPLAGKKQAPPWYWQALKNAVPLKNEIELPTPKNKEAARFLRLKSAQALVC